MNPTYSVLRYGKKATAIRGSTVVSDITTEKSGSIKCFVHVCVRENEHSITTFNSYHTLCSKYDSKEDYETLEDAMAALFTDVL